MIPKHTRTHGPHRRGNRRWFHHRNVRLTSPYAAMAISIGPLTKLHRYQTRNFKRGNAAVNKARVTVPSAADKFL